MDLRGMLLDSIYSTGDVPEFEQIAQYIMGQLGTPYGSTQGMMGKLSRRASPQTPKQMRPLIRGMDIFKELGIKI